ncbi:hypothetical protein J4G08_03525 [Candidatus Poribacteria bacterium]|nr:hypothetical protein [Candidatus Poribacteria bacterium]
MYRNLISIIIGLIFIIGGFSIWVVEIQANEQSTPKIEQQQVQTKEKENTCNCSAKTDEKDEAEKPETDTQEQAQVNVYKEFTAEGYRQVLTKQLDEDTQVTVRNEHTPDGKQHGWSAGVEFSLDNDGKAVRILKKTVAVVTYVPKKIGQGAVFVGKSIKKLFR